MKTRTQRSDFLLLLTALIWGMGFVAQRAGMAHIGPFLFNGLRFGLGALCLLPLLHRRRKQNAVALLRQRPLLRPGGFVAGLVLFAGATLQQVGLVYTTAGKAGFITGLYVVFVPILGMLFGQQTARGTWLGAVLATAGLYLLSFTGTVPINPGDLLVLAGALVWAGHVLIIDRLVSRLDAIALALRQFAICSLLSLLVALVAEPLSVEGVYRAAIPILYAGLLSVGIGFTLQVVAQREAHPAHAAIIMSLEAAFAALGGWLLLGEILSRRELLGCLLMLLGMFLSQAHLLKKTPVELR